MLEKKEKVIDGIAVSVTPFPVWHAMELKFKLAKRFIPGILAMAGAGDSLLEMNMSQFAKAADNLLAGMEVTELMNLIAELCEWVEVKNSKGEKRFLAPNKEMNEAVLNDVFPGKITVIYKIVFFVLEVNYPDFFGAGSKIGKLIQKTNTMQPEPKSG